MQTKTHKSCGCKDGGDTCHCRARPAPEQRESHDAPQERPATNRRPNVGHSFGRVDVINGPDAGTPDAGIRDASTPRDAAAPRDAATPDAGTPRDAGAPDAGTITPPATPTCTAPTGITLASTATITSPHATRGGICASMEVTPSTPTPICNVVERVSQASSTCPPMFRDGDGPLRGVCAGGSTFTVGRAGRGLCDRARPPAANQFNDRHQVQVPVSVLHDRERNPRRRRSCSTTCAQEYFVEGAPSTVVGRFHIRYDFVRGNDEGRDLTIATVTKTPVAPPRPRGGGRGRGRGRTP